MRTAQAAFAVVVVLARLVEVVDDVAGPVVLVDVAVVEVVGAVVADDEVELVDDEVGVVVGDPDAGPTSPGADCRAPTSVENCRTPHPLASS